VACGGEVAPSTLARLADNARAAALVVSGGFAAAAGRPQIDERRLLVAGGSV